MERFSWKPGATGAILPGKIAELLLDSEVVILPTDTIYGLHAVASDSSAVAKIYRIKSREVGKPLPVLFATFDQLLEIGARLSTPIMESLEAIWPAPLTAILPIAQPIPATAGHFSIAARIPDLEWLRALIEKTGPLASTSANLTGNSPAPSIATVDKRLLQEVAAVVDFGPLVSQPSTLVDFTENPPRVVREGAFSFTQNLWKTL